RVGGALSFNAFARDISDRLMAQEALRKESTLIQLLQSVTVAANRSSSIEHTAQTCLSIICSHTGWPLGHAFLQANDSSGLLSKELWCSEEGGKFTPFREATSPSTITDENG